MNTKNSKTSYLHELLHKLTNKVNLKKGWKCVQMMSLIYPIDHVLKSDIEDYFEYIIKKHEKLTD